MKRNVIEIGFMAASRGWETEAREIFEGVENLCPESPAPFIGMALAAMSQAKHNAAVEILREGLVKLPAQEELRVFLGLALHLASETKESKQILEELASPSTAVGEMASMLLKE